VITACAHAQEHSFSRLLWLVDVYEIIRKNTRHVREDILSRRCEELGFSVPVYFVLSYLKKRGLHVGHLLPEEAPFGNGYYVNRAFDFLIREQRQRISGDILGFFLIPGIRRKAEFIKQVIFVDREHFPLATDRIGAGDYAARTTRLVFGAARDFLKSFV
jgi:hypothetical protein